MDENPIVITGSISGIGFLDIGFLPKLLFLTTRGGTGISFGTISAGFPGDIVAIEPEVVDTLQVIYVGIATSGATNQTQIYFRENGWGIFSKGSAVPGTIYFAAFSGEE